MSQEGESVRPHGLTRRYGVEHTRRRHTSETGWSVGARPDVGGTVFWEGYDTDICLEARAGGRRVVEDLEVAHHYRRDFFDRQTWVQAEIALQRKWFRRWPQAVR